jgi:hypothetical protein
MNESMSAIAAAVWLCMVDQARRLRKVNVDIDTIVEGTELDHGWVEIALDELADDSRVETWHAGDGTVVTLSPLSAARLGLKLRLTISGYTWQAVSHRDHQPRVKRLRRVDKTETRNETDHGITLDRMAGPASRPDQHAEAHEAVQQAAPEQRRGRLADSALNPDRLPRPTALLDSPEPWTWQRPQCCPACKGKKLEAMSFCLRCDNWGLDWLLARISRDEMRSVAAVADSIRTAEAVRVGRRAG